MLVGEFMKGSLLKRLESLEKAFDDVDQKLVLIIFDDAQEQEMRDRYSEKQLQHAHIIQIRTVGEEHRVKNPT